MPEQNDSNIEKPFKCPKCKMRFKNQTELKRHFEENEVCFDFALDLLISKGIDIKGVLI